MNTREADARNIDVRYRNGNAALITVHGTYPDGEYRHKSEYTFRMDGSTAVLKKIDTDGVYSVRAAEPARAAVREAIEELPFVQAVSMFPEN